MIQATLTLSRIQPSMGDCQHYISISINGIDPVESSASFSVEGVVFTTISFKCVVDLIKNDTVSINYSQTERSDEIECIMNFMINEI